MKLCSSCSDSTTSIFSEFSVDRTQASKGSDNCRLCEILSQRIPDDPSGDKDTGIEPPKIVRSGSSLELSLGGSTEALYSIVIGPG
jgi:hypothetical protein